MSDNGFFKYDSTDFGPFSHMYKSEWDDAFEETSLDRFFDYAPDILDEYSEYADEEVDEE